MSEQTLDAAADASAPAVDAQAWREVLWSLPQPILVLGSMTLVALAITTEWMNADLFTTIMIVLPLPLVLVAERIWKKREDWTLEPGEFLEDAGWLAAGAFVWVPIYSDYYETPISRGFEFIRDQSALSVAMQPESTLGLLGCAVLVLVLSEFIYYWLHRVQHESFFWWRIHATHHHITKMSAARGDRTHPLEWATLMLSRPIVLALLGASGDVVAVVTAFGFWQGYLNHSNLPLRTNRLFALVFSTAQMHHLHHALDMDSSNKNYGCSIIVWDRLFGTFSDRDIEGPLGAGTGAPLSVPTQLALAFYPSEKLKSL